MKSKDADRRRKVGILSLAVLLVLASSSCIGSSTPPGANKYLGSFEQGGYVFLRWQEGLEVMIWYDVAGSSMAHSAGSTDDSVSVEQGFARSADGRNLEWDVQTRDGKRGEVQIGGASYDLASGSLFVVTTKGATQVRQLERDLSAVPLNHDGILAFAADDPDLATLLSGEGSLP